MHLLISVFSGKAIRKKRSSIRKISGYGINPEKLPGKNKSINRKFPDRNKRLK
jgi:hypothetical protein